MPTFAEIENVSRRIAQEYHPEKIVLFGSHAEGQATSDSDVDLLIILPFSGREADKTVEMLLKLHPPFPTDLIVRTPAAVQRRLDMGDPFLIQILEEGRVLYEAGHE